jgi:hypothetical protein
MRKLPHTVALILALVTLSGQALAAPTCEAQATEKKLAGAAKSSFIKKCEKDSPVTAAAPKAPSCEDKAAEKKLAGAAKSSFVKKCSAEAASGAK